MLSVDVHSGSVDLVVALGLEIVEVSVELIEIQDPSAGSGVRA